MGTDTKHGAIWVALIVAVVTAAGTAQAAPGVVVIGGTAPEHQRAAVSAAVAQVTRAAGWAAPASAISKSDAAALLGCADTTTPWSCVPASFAAGGIQRVLVVTVDAKPGESGSPIVVLVGKLIVTSPESAVVRQRFCEHCADDRLGEASTELAQGMLRELAVRGGRTVVVIQSEPPGAQIVLDGERIGATNGTYNTFPGKHVVVIEKPGYETETRELTAEEGRSSKISVALRASGLGEPAPQATRRSRLIPGLMIGAGVVSLGAGIALQVTKDGPPLGEPQSSRIYSAPGIGLAVVGGALAGIGTYLWLRASRTADATSTPAVTLVEGGGLLGWSHHY